MHIKDSTIAKARGLPTNSARTCRFSRDYPIPTDKRKVSGYAYPTLVRALDRKTSQK